VKLAQHKPNVWLINTGWTGGPSEPIGDGHRMPIQATRALMHAVLSGRMDDVDYRTDETFGFEVPVSAPGVDASLLDPRSTWADPAAYEKQARELATMFRKNFEKFADAGPEVVSAGPKA
jgi:phosphoenolpyruvate carboxykinase (ATP)